MLKYRDRSNKSGLTSISQSHDHLKSINDSSKIIDENCYFHPMPKREKLPSGILRKQPKKTVALIESPLNRNKERRSEERAARNHKTLQ